MIVLILFIFVIPILILIGENFYNNFITHHYKKRKGKFGRISIQSSDDIEHIIEIQEISRQKEWSRVRILRVYIKIKDKDSKPTILSDDKYIEWVETEKISWY